MMRHCLSRLRGARVWLLVVAALFASCAWAQGYPSKPVRLVVPLAPGGGNDILARALGQRLQESLHQPVVIENRPGAGGNVGSEYVARTPGDGYTLLMITVAQVMNPWLYKHLPFDIQRDFTPVAMLATLPLLVLTHPSLPVKSVADLVAYARANPHKLNYSTPGAGTPHHLATEMFKKATGTDLVHVPYKGGAPAVAALVSGEVQMMFGVLATTLPLVKAGKLRALATAEPKRVPALPDLPTVAETGIQGFSVENWYGIVGPAGMPPEVVSRLSDEIRRALESPALHERMAQLGFVTDYRGPDALRSVMAADLDKWGKVIRSIGVSAD